MGLKTRITPIEELQKLLVETLMNISSKVTKVSDHSVLNGVSFGVAKIGQKAIKDIALIESYIFIENATSEQLDTIAANSGVSPRLGVLGSSSYLRVVAAVGTQYLANTHIFSGVDGIQFQLEEDYTMNAYGFAYLKVKSLETGSKTNLNPYSVNSVSPLPSGHKYCINEYRFEGGRDLESDDLFRRRIRETPNINSQKTLSFLDQLFISVNPKVLRTFFYGFNGTGKVNIAVASVNGADFTDNEFNDILNTVGNKLSILDHRDFDSVNNGLFLQNIQYQEIDLDFRIKFDGSLSDIDQFRIQIQIKLQKLIDYRFWKLGSIVYWGKFYETVSAQSGTIYLPNKFFKVNGGFNDIIVSKYKLPRLRSFVMRDLDGNIIGSATGNLLPVFYPNNPNEVYIENVAV